MGQQHVRKPNDPVIFVTAYGPKVQYNLECKDESLTKQQFKDIANVNSILKRYEKTGQIDHLNPIYGHYADVSNIGDYQSALNIVMKAEEAFSQLPANIRRKFENDPGQFVQFCENPENINELVQMGLAVKKEDSIQKVEVINQQAASADKGQQDAP